MQNENEWRRSAMASKVPYGICKECGKAIEFFEYALKGLESWYCERCYFMFFPRAKKPPAEFLKWESSIPGEESYEFLKEHLYDKPHLYERSFRKIRPLVTMLKCFEGLAHLLEHLKSDYDKSFRSVLKADLKEVAGKYPHLFPQVVEVLMFVLWDNLVEKYGRGERFSESYWDLICELKQQD